MLSFKKRSHPPAEYDYHSEELKSVGLICLLLGLIIGFFTAMLTYGYLWTVA